ncbi:hypothetical protein AYO44_04665 [Planctomycetaceae bacterium SCGC AG-212-F19]|nr:hypothetical protein AYO44_04665 [Planctomycetaceae bacterium SCGC AG-212-F19]
MKEKDWLSATNPEPMFEHLEGETSDRKSRLFAVACARRVADLLTPARCRRLVELAKELSSLQFEGSSKPGLSSCLDAINLGERSADESVADKQLHSVSEAAYAFTFPASDYAGCWDESQGPFDTQVGATGSAAEAASYCCKEGYGLDAAALHAARAVAQHRGVRDDAGDAPERSVQCQLLREIFGNPFRPLKFEAGWRSPKVVSLAKTIYDKRSFDKMSVLADELEKAGCHNKDILGHCRGGGEHVRGCWVVDLVLGKD